MVGKTPLAINPLDTTKNLLKRRKEREASKAKAAEELSRKKGECLLKGGKWDEATQTCIMPKEEPPRAVLTSPEVYTHSETGRPSGIELPDGRTFLGLGPKDVEKIAQGEAGRGALPEGTAPVGTAQAQVNKAFEAQQMMGQVGQFGQLPVEPTGLNYGEAVTTGLVQAIPRALSYAITAGIGGAIGVGAATGGVGAPAGAVIGGVAGFLTGLTSGMISNLKSQRSDTTTAQQRVLDEGKQTMKDWATLAAADPANKTKYLAEYNKVAAQIDQAYRQMKLDTSRDLAKFETALPNLAEFEAFYAAGGEKDALDMEMRNSLLSPVSIEYQMLELAQRRQNNDKENKN